MITLMQWAAELRAEMSAAPVRVSKVVDRHGQLLLADVKRRASRSRTLPSTPGEPPRLQTGNYNRSIRLELSSIGGTRKASVGTNAVQGARLEFGFQAPGQSTYPHPHFRPALGQLEPDFVRALNEVLMW